MKVTVCAAGPKHAVLRIRCARALNRVSKLTTNSILKLHSRDNKYITTASAWYYMGITDTSFDPVH